MFRVKPLEALLVGANRCRTEHQPQMRGTWSRETAGSLYLLRLTRSRGGLCRECRNPTLLTPENALFP